jgi:pentatricopeptide repeat protein
MKTRGQNKGVQFFCAISNRMINMCSQLGITENVRQVTDKIPKRAKISWNTMLSKYLLNQNRRIENAGHKMLPEKDVVSWNEMIVGFARNGQLEQASIAFDKMAERNVVSWNAMLAAYIRNGKLEDGQKVFRQTA